MAPKIVILLLDAVLLTAIIGVLRILIRSRTPWNKLSIILNEPHKCLLFAGEMAPRFYRKVRRTLDDKPALKLEIISGPWVLVDDEAYDRYCDKNGRIRHNADYAALHPVFAMLRDLGDQRLSLYLKRKTLPEERHFGIGVTTGEVFLEYHHGHGPAIGGVPYADRDIFLIKKGEFEWLRRNPEMCTHTTWANLGEKLRECDIKCYRSADWRRIDEHVIAVAEG